MTAAGVKAKPCGRPTAGLDPGSTQPTTGCNRLMASANVDVYFAAPQLRACGPDRPRRSAPRPLTASCSTGMPFCVRFDGLSRVDSVRTFGARRQALCGRPVRAWIADSGGCGEAIGAAVLAVVACLLSSNPILLMHAPGRTASGLACSYDSVGVYGDAERAACWGRGVCRPRA